MLKNYKIIVIGAAGLLGSQLCIELLRRGAIVTAVDKNLDALSSLQKLLLQQSSENNLKVLEVDTCDEQSVISLFQNEVFQGLVNCSYPRNASYGEDFDHVTYDSFIENVSMQIGSNFLLAREAIRSFKSNSSSKFSFVNIGSIYGSEVPKFEIYNDLEMAMPVEYALSKAALNQLTKYVAGMVNNSNFRINTVSPGGIFDNHDDLFAQKYKSYTFGKGMLHPSEITGCITFLLGPDSEYINGQNIYVDDGFTVK
jgi:NAD(P)-dependent dehydrogenase (short-subunit alcohol dehydrogenase family)